MYTNTYTHIFGGAQASCRLRVVAARARLRASICGTLVVICGIVVCVMCRVSALRSQGQSLGFHWRKEKLINCRCTSELRLRCVLSRSTSTYCNFGRMSGTFTVLFHYLRSSTNHCFELHEDNPLCGRVTMAHRDHQKKKSVGHPRRARHNTLCPLSN